MFFVLIHLFVITEPPVTVTHPLVGGSVSEGEVARLECKLSSETEEKVIWFKGKEQIQAGGRYEILSDGKKQILIIRAFKPEDQDTYTCMVSPEVKSVASLCLEGTESTLSQFCLWTSRGISRAWTGIHFLLRAVITIHRELLSSCSVLPSVFPNP